MKIENKIPVPELARWIQGIVAFLIFVILWGAYVRSTGSGAGCGSHWPLCNGEVIPVKPSTKTRIEFFHRITSGMSLILVLWTGKRVFSAFPKGQFIRKTVGIASVSILVEALIGAGLVIFELVYKNQSIKRTISISLHFANTLVLLGALSLTYASVFRRGNGASWQSDKMKHHAYFLTVLFFILGMAGSITALGDTLFPAESLRQGIKQDWSPASHFLLKLRVIHPLLATLFASLSIPWITSRAYSCTSIAAKKLGARTVALLVANLALGLANLIGLAPTPLQILHLFVALCVWISWVLFLDSLARDSSASSRRSST